MRFDNLINIDKESFKRKNKQNCHDFFKLSLVRIKKSSCRYFF